jgi:hypothetical protein
MLRNRLTGDPMIRAGLWVLLVLSAGCARSSADLLDASLGSIGGDSDGGVSVDGDQAVDDQGDDADGAEDGPDDVDVSPDDDGDGADGDAADGDGDGSDVGDLDDGTGDADGVEMDAAVPDEDASQPGQPVVADFLVRQSNAALDTPLATNLPLNVGDTVRITGRGNIWPGLIAQGCCGPTGTSGSHSGSDWPLQGGPDFALVAFVNGAWKLVGNDGTFDVTVAGSLQLGTNDNDPGTGDDCTSVPNEQRGFSAHVVITPAD